MCSNQMMRSSIIAGLRHFFIKDEKGTSAVEFALIGAPFFAVLGFMLLGGHILWLSQSMDTSIQMVSRQIRTGQAQAAGMSMTQFRNTICDAVATSPVDCRAKLIIDVRRFDGPEDIHFNPPQKNGGVSQEAGAFQMGGGEDFVIAKVYYPVDYLTVLASLLGSTKNFDFQLSATAAFRNEPFS